MVRRILKDFDTLFHAAFKLLRNPNGTTGVLLLGSKVALSLLGGSRGGTLSTTATATTATAATALTTSASTATSATLALGALVVLALAGEATTATAEATTTATTSAATAVLALLALTLLLNLLGGLLVGLGDDGLGEVEVLAEIGDTVVVQGPVEVTPSELLLNEATALHGADQGPDLEAGDGELLSAELAGPGTQGVLLADAHALGEEVAVDVVTGLLWHQSRHAGQTSYVKKREGVEEKNQSLRRKKTSGIANINKPS